MSTTSKSRLLLGIAFLAAASAGGAHAQAVGSAAEVPNLSVEDERSGRVQLTLTGTRFTSRDQLEADLLRRAALLTRQKGHDWFMLLHLPGEGGSHPARAMPSFGSRYGHWQPHWSYLLPEIGWQPWHPEWGAPFWTTTVEPSAVERFQLHAMIEVGRGPVPARETAFDARRVLKDLAAASPRRGRAPTSRQTRSSSCC